MAVLFVQRFADHVLPYDGTASGAHAAFSAMRVRKGAGRAPHINVVQQFGRR